MKLAIQGEEKLEDIINYLIYDYNKKYNSTELSRLSKDKVVRERCMFHDSDTFFTYEFVFKNSNLGLDCVFYKSDYYKWISIQQRSQKINKIRSRI